MTDESRAAEITADADLAEAPAAATSNLVSLPAFGYFLMLLGFFTGISFIVGVIIAYVGGDSYAGDVLMAHRKFQIRTFWWSLLGMFLAGLTWLFAIGWLIALVVCVWTLYRIIKGIVRLSAGKQP